MKKKSLVLAFIALVAIVQPALAESELQKFNKLFDDISNWGRWGADDQLGTLNHITPRVRKAAAALVKEGRTLSLSRTMDKTANPINFNPVKHQPFIFDPASLGIDPAEAQDAAGDIFEINYHGFSHTHLDAINHFARNGKMYNGYPFKLDEQKGFNNLGVETISEAGIISRGVLVDFPRQMGKDYIPAGTALTIADIEAWEKATGVTVKSGDVLLIRTGRWVETAKEGFWPFSEKAAGLHYTTAKWLKQRGVAVIGCDGVSDVMPSGVAGKLNPLHELVLVSLGMPIFDNMDLDALADELAKLKRHTFLFSASPLKIEGATGAPLNPMAIF